MYPHTRFEPVSRCLAVLDRVAEDEPAYGTDTDTADTITTASRSIASHATASCATAVSPDIAARHREGQALRLALALVEGASTASADRQAKAARLREVGYRAGGAHDLPGDGAELVARLSRLVRGGDRALAEQLRLLPAFERSALWRRAGCRDCAAWLDRELGVSRVVALERLRVARRFAELPTLESLFAAGTLSWSKVRELTRVADAGCEQALAAAALELSASETVELCRRWRHRQDDPEGSGLSADAAEAAGAMRAFEQRCLTCRKVSPHTVRVTLELPLAEAAEFVRALECVEDELREDDREAARANVPSTVGARDPSHDAALPANRTARQLRADAAVLMCAKALAHAGEAVSKADRYRVLLNLDARLLVDDPDGVAPTAHEPPPERPGIAGHGPIPIETARRIAAFAGLTVIATLANGETVGVSGTTRAWPKKVEQAIRARDRCCQMPGCTATRWTHLHHVVMVSEGGETSVENGTLMCGSCHVRLHEGGLRLERVSAGDLAFGEPAGGLGLDTGQASRARRFVASVQRYRLVRADGTLVAGPKRRLPAVPASRGADGGAVEGEQRGNGGARHFHVNSVPA